jgi:phospholipid/cholesterol/gamma-HCH transport system substrate-binding protein
MAFYRSKLFWGVAAALLMILGAYGAIHLIPGKYFERGDGYVTYFDESVQGLQENSRVRYRGVDVGVVMNLRLAPDQKLIEVPLKLRLKKDVAKEVVAQLKVNPISGQVYLELDRIHPDEKVRTFKLAFTPKDPVIPSRFGDIQKAMSGLNILVQKLEDADAKGIFDQVKSTVKQVEVFFRGPRMESILEKVEGTMANLKSVTGNFDKIIASGRVEEVLAEARNTLKETHTTLTRAQGLIVRMDEAVGRTASLAAEIKATNDNLRHATETLDTLMNRINERPSDLLFGIPSPGRFNEQPGGQR